MKYTRMLHSKLWKTQLFVPMGEGKILRIEGFGRRKETAKNDCLLKVVAALELRKDLENDTGKQTKEEATEQV